MSKITISVCTMHVCLCAQYDHSYVHIRRTQFNIRYLSVLCSTIFLFYYLIESLTISEVC